MPKYKTYNDVPVKKYKTYDDVKVKTHWEEDATQPLDADTVANNPVAPALLLAKRDGNVAAAKELPDNAPYVQAGRDGINAYVDAVAESERQDAAAKAAAVQATMQPMGYGGLSKALRDGSMPKKKNTKVKETLREGNPKYNEDYVPGVDYPKFRAYDDVERELADVQARRDADFNARFPEAGELVQRSVGGKDADADRQLRELAQQYADENAAYDARIAELKKEVKDSKDKTVAYRREREAARTTAAEAERFGDAALADVGNGIKTAREAQRAAEAAQREADAAEAALHDYEDTLRANGVSEQYFGTDSHYIELAQAASNAKKSADTQKHAADADLYTLRGAQTLATLPEASRNAIFQYIACEGTGIVDTRKWSGARTVDLQTGQRKNITKDEFVKIRDAYDAAISALRENGASEADINRMLAAVRMSIDTIAAVGDAETIADLSLRHPVAMSAASVITNLSSGLFAGVGEAGRAGGNIGRGEDYRQPMNIYGAAYAPARMTNDIRGTIAERIEEGNGTAGKVGSFAYQTLMSTADSVVASVLGNVGGAAAIGGSAYASAIVDAKEKGYTDAQALATGIAAGIFETLFERVSIGNFNALKEVPPATVRDVAKNVVKSTVVNASEEAATEIANIIADAIIGGDFSDYAEAYNNHLAEVRDPSKAKRLALTDMAKQVGMAALGGAVQGGFMGGIGTTWGYFGNRDANRAAGAYFTDENGRINAENRNALIGEGLASENEEIRTYAGTLEDRRTMSQAEAGQLYRMLVAETQGNYAEEKEKDTSPFKIGTTASSRTPGEDVSLDTIIQDSLPAVNRTSADDISIGPNVAANSESQLKKLISASAQQIKRFLQNAVSKKNQYAYIKIADVEPTLADALTGITENARGRAHVLSDNDIRHILNKHGESSGEKFPVTLSELEKIPHIIHNYDNLYQGYDTKTGNKTVVYEYSEGSRTFYVEEILSGGNMSSKQMIIVGANSKPSFLKKYKKIVIGIANDTDVAEQNRSTGQQTSPATTSMTQRHSTDYNNSIAQTAADSQVFPDFSDRSPDEPISEAEFRAVYAARVAREAAAERAKTQADTDLGNMLSGELTNGRADEIAKSQSLTNAFEALTGEKLTGTLAEKRKQLKAMQTFAAEKLRGARADARMAALKTADTREKMRAAVGTAGQAVYDAGYDAGVAAYKLRGFAGDALLAPSELYNANFGAYYRQGYRGDAFDFPGNAVIGEADARRIFDAGRRDAKADTYLNAAERSAFEHGVSAEKGATAKRLSQVLGREILFIDAGADFHGCTIDGVIYIGAKSDRSVLATVAHEYTHLLEGKGLYKKLRDFVFDTLAGEGAAAEDLRASKRAEHELYVGLDDAQIDREIVAEFVETRLLTDEQVMRAVVRREGKSFARRLLDTLRTLVEKVKAALHIGNADAEQLKMLERGRNILAEVVQSEEAAEKTGVEASGGIQLLIARSDKNIPVLVIDADIAKNKTGQADLIREVKDSISKIPYVAISKQRIYFTSDTKRETTFSKYSKWLKSKAADVFIDKMRAVYNIDELVLATTDYVNEGLKHPRKDNIVDFARGRVLMDILGKQYTADVVVGFTDKGICELHDVVNINPTQFGYKKTNDALSTISSEDEHLQKRTSFVNTTVAQNSSGVNSKYTQNSKNDADIGEFSVGGVNAKTAEVGRLADAERMEQGGADSETVRRETGWYRGYDGKWRFEIDDSKLRFINHREESRRTWKLDELIRHDALFAAYPELRNYTVLNFGIADGVEAAFYPGLNRITLDPQLNRAEKRAALIHEIQHAIQVIEGFAAGSSTDYWQDAFVTDEEKRTERHLQELAWKNHLLAEDMYKLLRDTPDARRDALRATFVQRHGEKAVREFTDTYNHLLDLQKQRTMRAERAYRDTAGEIEAADVANRLGLSAKQRAETRPDIDRTNVRFSSLQSSFSMEARKAISDFVDEAIDNKGRTDEERNQIRISEVPQNIADAVYRASAGRITISGKYFALEGSSIYHEFTRRSDSAKEHAREQLAFSRDDIKKSAEIFYSPDIVECIFADKENPAQRQAFAFAKEAEDSSHYVLVVESVGGKSNPNIIPVEMLKIKSQKWNRYIGAGKSIADMVYANDPKMLAAVKHNAENINNRVTVARLSAQNARSANFSTFSSVADSTVSQKDSGVNSYSMQNPENNAETDGDIRFSVGDGQTDADAEVSDTDKRFAPVESAIKLLKGGADLWRTQRETGAQPKQIALRMATSGESDAEIRRLTGLYRDALGVWTYDKAWLDAHVPDIADTRALRAGYKLGTVDEQLLGLAPDEVKASRRRLLDSAKLPADADAARVRQTAANLHRGLRPTAAEFAEDRKTAAAKEAARLITKEKVPSADAAIRTGALLADIADVLEKKGYVPKSIIRFTAQVRGEDGAWVTDNAAMTKIIRAGSKQLDVQDFTDFLFENAKELTESSYNSQYGHRETYALDKLGVQIENPIVDISQYGTKPSELIANEREQEELKRYIENEYAHVAHPSPAERADARDAATGIRTLGQISGDSRREVVLDLVYANLARRGLRDNGIETFYMVQKQRYAEELAQNIFKMSIEPGKKAVQQWRLTANTALRNNRMVFGEEVGRYLNETIFEKVVDNEAERQRFMQREIDKIRKLKLTKLESQAVQMLAEDTKESRLAFYELLKGKGKNLDVEKCRAAVTVFRGCYNLYYDAINEFLVMHGYKPIGFQKNYMPRLQKEADVSALRERLNALGIETEEVTELPAEIAGRTETFKPGKKYNPFFEHRTSKENKNVQYDALGGFDSYITYLSEVLYHTDDIQKLRTLAGVLRERYASGAVSKNIAELKEQLYSPDPDKSFADIEAKLTAAYEEVKLNNYFGTYATWLDDYTNNIAGKQTSFDRAFEYNIGRKTLNLGKRLNNTYSAAVIVGNLSSAFNQTVQLPFALTECGIRNMTRAFVDMLPRNDRLNKVAEFDKKSTFLAGKRGVDYASERAWNEKVTAAGGKFFEAVDMTVTRLILRAKYYQATEANPNISFDEAIREADRYISSMVGNRMKGAKPVLFNQKNVITRTLTAFQLEQLNFVEYVARDVPAKFRAYQKVHGTPATVRKIARELLSALINVFVFNRLAELLYGQTPAAGDVLGILVDSLGAGWNLTGNDFLLTLADDLCQEMTGQRRLGTRERGDFSTRNALGEFGDEVGDDVPLVNNILAMLGVTNSKLPLPQVKAVTKSFDGDFKGAAAQIPADLATWVPFGSQIKKTARGVKLIADKGMYSSSGKLMFASDMNLWDCIRAVLFGPTANEEYRESFFGGRYLSAEETALWQQMRAAGGKPKESFDALQDVYNAGAAVREADPDAPSAEVKAAKVEKIDNLPLNGRLKALILYGDVASENEKAVMDALEVTLQVDHMKVYRFMSGFVLQEKVADKREYLKHDLVLTDAEKATVYYHYFANDDAQDFIDELRRRGGRDADIYKVLAASYGQEEEKITTADRATAIADSSLPAAAKEEAMYELISDELHDKYTAVQDAGGNVDEFLAAYAATRGITSDKDRAGNTVALSKARKMKKAIDAAVPDAPKKVRRALYSAFGVSKSVWY